MAATIVLNDTRDPTRTHAAFACRLAAHTPGLAEGSLPSFGSLQFSRGFRSGVRPVSPPLLLPLLPLLLVLLPLSLLSTRVADDRQSSGDPCCRCRWVDHSPAGLLQRAALSLVSPTAF